MLIYILIVVTVAILAQAQILMGNCFSVNTVSFKALDEALLMKNFSDPEELAKKMTKKWRSPKDPPAYYPGESRKKTLQREAAEIRIGEAMCKAVEPFARRAKWSCEDKLTEDEIRFLNNLINELKKLETSHNMKTSANARSIINNITFNMNVIIAIQKAEKDKRDKREQKKMLDAITSRVYR